MSEMIPLDKIDDSVITAIRNIKKDDETYKLLESAIKKDGQRHPITVRKLTDEEKAKAKENLTLMLNTVLLTGIIVLLLLKISVILKSPLKLMKLKRHLSEI